MTVFNKEKCVKCKYHNYLSNLTGTSTRDYKIKHCFCNRAVLTKETCLKRIGKEVVDRRGTDPDNCKLFEEGKRLSGSKALQAVAVDFRNGGLSHDFRR